APGGERLALLVELVDHAPSRFIQSRGQRAGHAPLELARLGGKLFLVAVETAPPRLLGSLARIAGVPALVDRLRHLEGRVGPADGRAGSGDLLRAERCAMRCARVR